MEDVQLWRAALSLFTPPLFTPRQATTWKTYNSGGRLSLSSHLPSSHLGRQQHGRRTTLAGGSLSLHTSPLHTSAGNNMEDVQLWRAALSLFTPPLFIPRQATTWKTYNSGGRLSLSSHLPSSYL